MAACRWERALEGSLCQDCVRGLHAVADLGLILYSGSWEPTKGRLPPRRNRCLPSDRNLAHVRSGTRLALIPELRRRSASHGCHTRGRRERVTRARVKRS
jgi:hypothetical protein